MNALEPQRTEAPTEYWSKKKAAEHWDVDERTIDAWAEPVYVTNKITGRRILKRGPLLQKERAGGKVIIAVAQVLGVPEAQRREDAAYQVRKAEEEGSDSS